MTRGAIWTVSGVLYAGKPRPAAVVQNDEFDATFSVTVCPITSNDAGSNPARVLLAPSPINGLRETSWLMADKLTTLPRRQLGREIGSLDAADLAALDAAITLFLGLA